MWGRKKHRGMHGLREHAGELYEDVRDWGEHTGERLARLGRRGGGYLAEGAERAIEGEERFEDFVRRHPIASVGGALGIGAVIGLLLMMRR